MLIMGWWVSFAVECLGSDRMMKLSRQTNVPKKLPNTHGAFKSVIIRNGHDRWSAVSLVVPGKLQQSSLNYISTSTAIPIRRSQ
jgi:hypothetical protein